MILKRSFFLLTFFCTNPLLSCGIELHLNITNNTIDRNAQFQSKKDVTIIRITNKNEPEIFLLSNENQQHFIGFIDEEEIHLFIQRSADQLNGDIIEIFILDSDFYTIQAIALQSKTNITLPFWLDRDNIQKNLQVKAFPNNDTVLFNFHQNNLDANGNHPLRTCHNSTVILTQLPNINLKFNALQTPIFSGQNMKKSIEIECDQFLTLEKKELPLSKFNFTSISLHNKDKPSTSTIAFTFPQDVPEQNRDIEISVSAHKSLSCTSGTALILYQK